MHPGDRISIEIPADNLTPFDRWVKTIQENGSDSANVEEAIALTRLAAAAEVSAAENRIVKLDEGH